MSSNDPTMDESYLQKLKYMNINGGGGGGDPDPPRYGRIMGSKAEPSVPTYHQKQRSIGAIESFAIDAAPQKAYKLYDRNNVISSSKFATPRQVCTKVVKETVKKSWSTLTIPERKRRMCVICFLKIKWVFKMSVQFHKNCVILEQKVLTKITLPIRNIYTY